MGIYKREGVYYIDYYFDGRRIRERVGLSWKQAQDALNGRKGEIAQGKFELKQTKTSPVFKDFAKKYLEWSKGNKRSWKRDRTAIKSFLNGFGGSSLNNITTWQVEKYKMKRSHTVKKSTVNRDLACLKHMFTMAIQWGLATENPAKPVKFFRVNNQRSRFLDENEEQSILSSCSDRIKPIVLTALNTGMRRGEILSLEWSDVDFNNRLITVKDSKNRESRKIPMNPTLIRLLKDLKKESQGADVFHYGAKQYQTVYNEWKTTLKKAGTNDFRFHDLRHTFASRLIMGGVDLVTVKVLLGHKTIDMTMRYSHLSQDHKRKAVEILESAPHGHNMDTRTETRDKIAAIIG
jgi:integrase